MRIKKYYLAYGSNLNIRQIRHRCPGAKPVGTSVIEDYELLFKGSKTGSYLTIEPKNGEKVLVAVWEITESDEKRLDFYEGFPKFYYKKNVEVTVNSQKIKAFVYIMHEEREIGVPSRRYMKTCEEGYRDFGFDQNFLATALEKVSRKLTNMKFERTERVCPICGKTYKGVPATSRTDNVTPICPDCGTRQSLETLGVGREEQEKILEIIHSKHENGG